MRWQIRNQVLDFGRRPRLMGIINATPDSFSDGGRFLDPGRAVEHGLALVAQGAEILDVGGESTRPGAVPVDEAEELGRVLPVVAGLARQTPVPISIDTSKAGVARRALEAGAAIVNDVTGLTGDREMAAAVRAFRAGVVVMHMQGTPQTMQLDPRYDDVVGDIHRWFKERLAALGDDGIGAEQVVLDPGIGFGKRLSHNLELLSRLDEFRDLGRPVCLGASRKGFINRVLNRPGHAETGVGGTVGVVLHAVARGTIQIARVHDVAAVHDAITLFLALERGSEATVDSSQ